MKYLVIALIILMSSCAAAASEGESAGNFRSAAVDTTDSRMITYEARVSIVVEDPAVAQGIAVTTAQEMQGFVTRNEISASIIRIPVGKFEEYLELITDLGTVDHYRVTGTDITDDYNDIVTRLESRRRLHDRYLGLLDQASSVQDMLDIERELERVLLEIERLEGQKASSEARVAYATVHLNIQAVSEKTRPGPIGWLIVGLYRGVRWLFIWD